MAEEENKKEEYKEQQVVTLKDFPQWRKIMDEYRCGDVFWCPKCESSIICLCETYSKNNITNSINKTDMENEDYKKIVLECGNCQHKDILIKFLKIIERTSPIIYDEGSNYPIKPYRSYKPKKPYYISPYPYSITSPHPYLIKTCSTNDANKINKIMKTSKTI